MCVANWEEGKKDGQEHEDAEDLVLEALERVVGLEECEAEKESLRIVSSLHG